VTGASHKQPPSAGPQTLILRVRRGVHFVVVAAVVWVIVLLAAGILLSDRAAIARFERAGPYIAAMTLAAFVANYMLRFARWQWMLVRLGAHVPGMSSLAIFMAGLGLLPTPGKIGVAARSLLLMRHGVPVQSSLAAYFAERLFDLAGLLLLAAIFYRGPLADGLTAVALIGVASIALVARYPAPVVHAMSRLVSRWPKLILAVSATARLLHAARLLMAFPQALSFVFLGMAANIVVGLLVCGVLGILSTNISIGTGIGAVALAHLSGSASMAPGGIGGFEVVLLLDLEHADVQHDDALLVLASVRIVTLWAGVVVGLPLMLSGLRRVPLTRKVDKID
jgi:uncharacterized membrane protein YbhN (UPF0104 family)